MKLTTRLLSFFLAALAVVLAAFAGAVYVLAGTHLQRQLDERLDAALATLAAAVEIERHEIEWDPAQRAIFLGRDDSPEQVRWIIHDSTGTPVDRSANFGGLAWPAPAAAAGRPLREEFSDDGGNFRLARRHVLPTEPRTAKPAAEWGLPPAVIETLQTRFPRARILDAQKRTRPGRTTWRLDAALPGRLAELEFADDGRVLKAPPDGPAERPESGAKCSLAGMTITAGASPEPMRETLAALALWLGGLSAGVWVAAAAGGRLLCRRALAPVTKMTAAIEAMSPADLGSRLPEPATRDEPAALAGAFNDLLTRVEVAFEQQKRFTADASHQFRTPLAVMAGQVDVALRRERSAEEYRRVLELLRRRITELEQIGESLLFLARADAEAHVRGLETADVRRLLHQAANRFRAHARNADLSVEFPAHGTAVRVHPQLFAQMLDNLLDNAAKYSRPGMPIRLGADRLNGTIAIRVEDAGPGIPADELPRLFQPFFRGAGAEAAGTPGTGLGLAVAERIARASGGKLEVRSEPGMGATFSITLPVVADEEPAPTAAQPSAPAPAH
jgi:signal transduction histidine kinase